MLLLAGLLTVLSGCGAGPDDSCEPALGRCEPPPGEEPGPSQTWSSAGSTSTFRIGHTATLLPNGKVLVVGGVNPISQQEQKATAELYDPGTGTWSSTGSLAEGRANHTATLLPNGKVLVAGGVSILDGSPEISTPLTVSTELYDPGTGSWSLTGSPASGRYRHTATPLPDGKVLVAGGAILFESLHTVSAEVYDPGTGTWSSTGSMAVGRTSHTATPLRNGKVMVVGGSPYPTAELYTP
jgi:hypothetical protein